MNRAFKIRLYPTKEQEILMWKHVGACRYIWNHMLSIQDERYKCGKKYLSAYNMISLLKPLKNDGEHEWLYEVGNKSLQIVCKDLDRTFVSFFNKVGGHPKYKTKKRARPAFPVSTECVYFKDEKYMQILKLGLVRYKTDYSVLLGRNKYKICDARIKYINNKWILILNVECESQARALTDISMGIDLGIKELAVVEFGGEQLVFWNINKSKKMRRLEKLKSRLQRRIAKKYEKNKIGQKYIKTNNIIREEEKLRKIWSKQSNIRNNYLHQTTHALVSLLPKRVVMEDLSISNLIKNKHLSKAIQEQCFFEFRRQMQYKCEQYGIEFLLADRFYPSSKTCSSCGCIKVDLKLGDRVFICSDCGLKIDRDYNAAINLSRYEI